MNTWRLDGYSEIGELGSGAQGRVVLARRDDNGELVAIKYLYGQSAGSSRVPSQVEARLLAMVRDDHVAEFHGLVEGPDGVAMVMEAVEGVSLTEILRDSGALEPEASLVLLKGSLLGLAAAHAVNIVHRDYKPGNVIVQADGTSKLIDFGIATSSGVRSLAGTPAYMAPEQWSGQPASPATDVYAATCVFFECVTGHVPYRGQGQPELMRQHMAESLPLAELPEPLRPLVAHGMAKQPADRHADAALFVAELEEVAVAAYGEDWERRGLAVLAAGALALAALFPQSVVATAVTASTGTTTAATVLSTSRRLVTRGPLQGASGSVVGAVVAGVVALVVAVVGTAYFVNAGGKAKHHVVVEARLGPPKSRTPAPAVPTVRPPTPTPSASVPTTAPPTTPAATPTATPTVTPTVTPSATQTATPAVTPPTTPVVPPPPPCVPSTQAAHDFGTVSTSATATISFTRQPCTNIGGILIRGGGGQFSAAPAVCSSAQPTGTCTVEVTFTPATPAKPGTVTATLVVTRTSGADLVTVPLTATVPDTHQPCPPYFADLGDMGTVAIGSSAAREFSYPWLACDNAPAISVHGGDGQFTVALASCPATGASGTCSFTVTFTPTRPGPATATIIVPTTDANPGDVTMTISGTGGTKASASPSVSITPSASKTPTPPLPEATASSSPTPTPTPKPGTPKPSPTPTPAVTPSASPTHTPSPSLADKLGGGSAHPAGPSPVHDLHPGSAPASTAPIIAAPPKPKPTAP